MVKFVYVILLSISVVFMMNGCTPKLQMAQQLSNNKSGWVYIKTDDEDVSGIFYCDNPKSKATCTKAKLK